VLSFVFKFFSVLFTW